MQDRNQSSTPRPKKRDGTQNEIKLENDANWFGASQEPQEEFIEGSSSSKDETADFRAGRASERHRSGSESEGEPTFSGSRERR